LDLTLYALEEGGRTRLSIVFRKELFDPSLVAQMLGHLETLLAAVAEDPDRRIDALPLLTEKELRYRATQINQVRVTNPFVEFTRGEVEQSIWNRFELQA